MIQDYIITVGLGFFCFTAIPMIFAKEKPPLLSSIPYGLILLVFAVTFTTIHLYFSALAELITGCEWLFLAYQKITQHS